LKRDRIDRKLLSFRHLLPSLMPCRKLLLSFCKLSLLLCLARKLLRWWQCYETFFFFVTKLLQNILFNANILGLAQSICNSSLDLAFRLRNVSCCSGRREGNGFVVAMEYGKREGIGFVVTTECGKLVVVGLVDFAVTIVYGFTS
jgi:hypothetical protein